MQKVSCFAKENCGGSRFGCSIAGDTPAATARCKITLRRRRCRGRGSRRAKIELHRRWPFRARLRSEKWFRRKTKHTGYEVCGETAHRHIIVLHSAIEVTAFDRDSVLGSFQLRLQTEKI